jgi:hypothetical protein
MDAEVYLNWGLLLANGTDGIVDLLVTALVRVPVVGCAGIHTLKGGTRLPRRAGRGKKVLWRLLGNGEDRS